MMAATGNQQSRNVFKKSSPNSKLTVYLGSRDIFDDLGRVDPIEGVVIVDEAYSKEDQRHAGVFARITCEFRYGREDMDEIISGVIFHKAFHLQVKKVYPPVVGSEEKQDAFPLSNVQERLVRKFDGKAYPFRFNLPHDIPQSVILQSGEFESPDNQPCGIQYSLQVFFGETEESQASRHNSVQVVIRRLNTTAPQSLVSLHKQHAIDGGEEDSDLLLSKERKFQSLVGNVKLEATLPRDVFCHSETIPISLVIDNLSSNSIKRIKIQVIQIAEVTIFRPHTFRNVIEEVESHSTKAGFPIPAGHSGWCHTVKLKPSLHGNSQAAGLALDGRLKTQESNLATSTFIKDYRKKDQLGVVVQYMIRVKAITGFGGHDCYLEVPFVLIHSRPELLGPQLSTK